jgi:hypothetical protein
MERRMAHGRHDQTEEHGEGETASRKIWYEAEAAADLGSSIA